jgi:hypothetical protein
MTTKVFKDSFDNCYLVDVYKQFETYYNFDFYPVVDCGEVYKLMRTFDEVTLETFKTYAKEKRLDPEFSFLFRINLGDQRFNADEILWEEYSAESLKEASEFCRSYWLENYEKGS